MQAKKGRTPFRTVPKAGQTDPNGADKEDLDSLCGFLTEVQSVHIGRLDRRRRGQNLFCLAFGSSEKIALSRVSPRSFSWIWIQVILEPHYAFLATPISWRARGNVLLITPRTDREDLQVYAEAALEYGGKPRIVKVGALSRNVFRTFLVAVTH